MRRFYSLVKQIARLPLRDWQTTLIGIAIIAFTTWAFLEEKIDWEQAVIGWHTGFGFIIARDMMDDDEEGKKVRKRKRISQNQTSQTSQANQLNQPNQEGE